MPPATDVSRISTSGTPDFGIVDIDVEHVSQILAPYLARGSQLTGVSLTDLVLTHALGKTVPPKPTLVDLLGLGVKLFDAIVWLSAGSPVSHPIVEDQAMTTESIPALQDIGRAVFYVYFFLLTQARYPAIEGAADPPNVPNFLRTVMGMTDPQNKYIELICGFTPELFDKKWIKHVKFADFGQEAQTRFGLGVAGYRLFSPFKSMLPAAPVPAECAAAFTFAQTVAKSAPTWSIHPATRDPAVLTKRGNLNKNLGNLILRVYSPAEIQIMVNSKMLNRVPTVEPAYNDYKTWTANDDISGTDLIFQT